MMQGLESQIGNGSRSFFPLQQFRAQTVNAPVAFTSFGMFEMLVAWYFRLFGCSVAQDTISYFHIKIMVFGGHCFFENVLVIRPINF